MISFPFILLLLPLLCFLAKADCEPQCHPERGVCINDACLCRTPWGGDDCTQIVGNELAQSQRGITYKEEDSSILYGPERTDPDVNSEEAMPSSAPSAVMRQSDQKRDNSGWRRVAAGQGFLASRSPSVVAPPSLTVDAGNDGKGNAPPSYSDVALETDSEEDSEPEPEAFIRSSDGGQDGSDSENLGSRHGAVAAHMPSPVIQAPTTPAASVALSNSLAKAVQLADEKVSSLRWISPGQSSSGGSSDTTAETVIASSSPEASSLQKGRTVAKRPSLMSKSTETRASEASVLRSQLQRAMEDAKEARHQSELAKKHAIGLEQQRDHLLHEVEGLDLDQQSDRASQGFARRVLNFAVRSLPSWGLPHPRKQDPASMEQLKEEVVELKTAEATEMEELKEQISRLPGATSLASGRRGIVSTTYDTNVWQKIAISVPLFIVIAFVGTSWHLCGGFVAGHADFCAYATCISFTLVAYASWVIICLVGLVDEYVKLACLGVYIMFVGMLFLWLLVKLLERCCLSSSSTPYHLGSSTLKRFNTMASKVRFLTDATKKQFKLVTERGAEYDSSDESDHDDAPDGIDIKVTILQATNLKKGADWFGKSDVYCSFVVAGRPSCGELRTINAYYHKDKEGKLGRAVSWDHQGKHAYGILRNVRKGDSLKLKVWDQDPGFDDLLGRAVGGRKGPGFIIGERRMIKLANGDLKDGIGTTKDEQFGPGVSVLSMSGNYCKTGACLKIRVQKAEKDDHSFHNVWDRGHPEEQLQVESQGLAENLWACSRQASPDANAPKGTHKKVCAC